MIDNNKPRLARRAPMMRLRFSLPIFVLASLALMGCSGNSTNNANAVVQSSPTPAATPTAPASTANTAFDGERAFEYVRKQVEFGPRPAGTQELARTRDYIINELKSFGLNVTTDEFTPQTPVGPRKMVNFTAEIPGESSDVIIISSHYDTKTFKQWRFVGANDGGSSTGALMEIARVMSANKQKPRFTYRFVFFDGEEAFCDGWDECTNPDGPDHTYGSRHYVAQLIEKNEVRRVRAMILLDMIGYKNLEIGRDEQLSTKWLVEAIWQTAREKGYGKQFVDGDAEVGDDDHMPFLKAGIESIDIIQLQSYPFWHLSGDTLDKISPQSLKIIGDVVLASLPKIEDHLLSKSG